MKKFKMTEQQVNDQNVSYETNNVKFESLLNESISKLADIIKW